MLRHRTVEAIVCDIEGTTTSLSFVKDVLFPYAAKRLPAYVSKHQNDKRVRTCLDDVAKTLELEDGIKDANLEQLTATLLKWIETDRKHTALKTLQGYIWEEGYRHNDYQGHIYQDVPAFMEHLRQRQVPLYIFSSGSVAAQKLLFAHTEYGDLTELINGYFDTKTGAKREPSAYQKILKSIKTLPEHTLFVSDVQEELDAAGEAGMQTVQIKRDGVKPAVGHHMVHDFTEFWPELRAHL